MFFSFLMFDKSEIYSHWDNTIYKYEIFQFQALDSCILHSQWIVHRNALEKSTKLIVYHASVIHAPLHHTSHTEIQNPQWNLNDIVRLWKSIKHRTKTILEVLTWILIELHWCLMYSMQKWTNNRSNGRNITATWNSIRRWLFISAHSTCFGNKFSQVIYSFCDFENLVYNAKFRFQSWY